MDNRPAQTDITDEKALSVMKKASGAVHAEVFMKLPDCKQEKAMKKMRQSGASLSQISRLTGISMARVRKIVVL